ncbi:MAG TPA: CocE/NonD family hydrolase [Gaiellaceae bacterium]|jgi:pimeloyl-ACP methyl ester carboxylesterase
MQDVRFGARLAVRIRSLVLLAIVLDLPVLARVAKALTPEPLVESLEIDGVPVEISLPARGEAWPAFVFVTGAHPLRRREPVVQRLARALARAGYLAVVPDLPGLGDGELTQRTTEAAVAVTGATAARPDVRDGRVALVGASAGASIALLTAARPELESRVSLVAAITPFADLEKIVCLATTRRYEETSGFVEYGVTPLLRRAVARSLVASLPECDDRERLLAVLGGIEDDSDPLDELQVQLDGPEAHALVRLLTNSDPARFSELYRMLSPDLLAVVRRLSPVASVGTLSAPVELAVPPRDPYFPFAEAQLLADSLANVRLTVTTTLDHTRPKASLKGLRDLARFDRFVLRSLATAA